MRNPFRRASPANDDQAGWHFEQLRATPVDAATAAALRTRFHPGDFLDATEPGKPFRLIARRTVGMTEERTHADGTTELVLHGIGGGAVRITDQAARERVIAQLTGLPIAAITTTRPDDEEATDA